MPDGCAWSEPAGGFFTWLTLPDGLDAAELRAGGGRRRRHLRPGPRRSTRATAGANELRLSFSHLGAGEYDEAVRRLASVVRPS